MNCFSAICVDGSTSEPQTSLGNIHKLLKAMNKNLFLTNFSDLVATLQKYLYGTVEAVSTDILSGDLVNRVPGKISCGR